MYTCQNATLLEITCHGSNFLFARVCSNVDDFNKRNLFLTAKNRIIDITKFEKHFLNSNTDTYG